MSAESREQRKERVKKYLNWVGMNFETNFSPAFATVFIIALAEWNHFSLLEISLECI